ncbi:MAG: hypothetical protein IRZ11_00605 [Clostridia bacterium]|nr:hypothetical protein [Clostridia bacterium]
MRWRVAAAVAAIGAAGLLGACQGLVSQGDLPLVVTYTPGIEPWDACPRADRLATTGSRDHDEIARQLPKAIAAVRELESEFVSSESMFNTFKVVRLEQAGEAGVWGQFVVTWCGADVAHSTWVVFVQYPNAAPSNSLMGEEMFVTKERDRWNLWYAQ